MASPASYADLGGRTERESMTMSSGGEIRVFLIADIRGYTRFTQERGDEAGARLAMRFAELATEGVQRHEGSIVELRGDEALAVFTSPRGALRAAVELQSRFVEETAADPSSPLRVGIGVDAGEAVPVAGGYRGAPLNVAARLCALAAPGEVLASQGVLHLARRVEGLRVYEQGPTRLKGIEQPVTIVKVVAETANPYKGLRAFDEADAPDFFGRESLTEQLVARLAEDVPGARFLAIVGPSGSGKSSVVRAGLVPALRSGALPGSRRCLVAVMVPGQQPMQELMAELRRVADDRRVGGDDLSLDPADLLRAAERVLPPDADLVLVIDQFEELFTLVEDEHLRADFLDALRTSVLESNGRLRIVLTLRADFYDRPLLYRDFGDLVGARTQTVTALSPHELERAVAGPAERAGVALEPGLVSQIVADVSSEPGALPLLQYAMTELFEHRRGNTMTLDAYRAIGGVSGALVRRAESLYGELDPADRDAARQLFLRLATSVNEVDVTRRRVPRGEILSVVGDASVMEAALDTFGAGRLLSFDRDPSTGVPTVEIAHEALLVEWARLRGWLEAAREDLQAERRLAAAAREWLDADRDRSFLVSGSRLEHFEGWRDSSDLVITPEQADFLDASRAEWDRVWAEGEAREARERVLERRTLRRTRALVAVLGVAALVAGALTVFAFTERGKAESVARTALARELAAAALANLEVDPERSILLALEAVAATRDADGTVVREAEEALHRAVTRSRVISTIPHGGFGLAVSSDGTRVATGGADPTDNTAKVWDSETGEELLVLTGPDVGRVAVTFSPDDRLIATTHNDATVRLWDAATGDELDVLRGHVEAVTFPEFSPNGELLAAGAVDGSVRVWDVGARALERTLTGHDRGFVNAAFSPDGALLATAGMDATVRVWDLSTGKTSATMPGGESPLSGIVFSPDGARIAAASQDGSTRIWASRSGDHLRTFDGPVPLDAVAYSPDGTRLATVGTDGTARVLDADTGGQLLTLPGHPGRAVNVTFTPDGDRLLTAALDDTTRLWDVSATGGRDWLTVPGAKDIFAGVTFSPDGSRFAAPAEPRGVTIWDATTGDEVITLTGHNAKLTTVAFSPDGSKLAAASERTRTPPVWDVDTGELLFRLRGHEETGWPIAFSPDGDRLVTGSFDGTARVWDSATGEEEDLIQVGAQVFSAAFSPDGRFIVTGDGAGDATVWDATTRGLVRILRGHVAAVEGLAFGPRGMLVTASSDATAKVWDIESDEARTTFRGHSAIISGVAVSPDGTRVATASDDGTTKLWDPTTGVEQLTLLGHDDLVFGVDFSPDGRLLATASPDGKVALHLLPIDEFMELARERVTRALTNEECRQYLHLNRCPT